jgi:N-glycosylase/DNA lyase
MKIDKLLEMYQNKKDEIQKRLKEFKEISNQSDERVFAELAFCICTPQSKAFVCDKSISTLEKNGLLFTGNEKQIENFLNGVRFPKNKAKYIVEARKFFTEDGKLKIKEKILMHKDAFELRDWLIENVKGLGIKEASHFIRNMGFGNEQLAILDRHILKNLKELGVIEEIPKVITRTIYLEIENKMREFSKRIKIPMYELDMLLWSKETGKVFK